MALGLSFRPRSTIRPTRPRSASVIRVWLVLTIASLAGRARAVGDEPESVRRGEVAYAVPAGDERVATRFRLAEHRFPYEMRPMKIEVNGANVWDLRFPSPVTTPHEANNTVHCEFFQSRKGPDRKPAVVVLHILGGDFDLARLFCLTISEQGASALFLKMPYYGPRRQEGVARRMISPDPRETVEGMTQAVLDIRRAFAWLESRDDVDPRQLGVFGISLGGITGALVATSEPRIANACLLLAGGDIGRVAWESGELDDVREQWTARGGTKEEFLAAMREIDPTRYGANAKGKRILMLNASDDEVIPRACTESLWHAFGEPDIHWYEGGHYSVARHIGNAMARVGSFFRPAP